MSLLITNDRILIKDINGEVSFDTNTKMPLIADVFEGSIEFSFPAHTPRSTTTTSTSTDPSTGATTTTTTTEYDGFIIPAKNFSQSYFIGNLILNNANFIYGSGTLSILSANPRPEEQVVNGGFIAITGSSLLETNFNIAKRNITIPSSDGRVLSRVIHLESVNGYLALTVQQSGCTYYYEYGYTPTTTTSNDGGDTTTNNDPAPFLAQVAKTETRYKLDFIIYTGKVS